MFHYVIESETVSRLSSEDHEPDDTVREILSMDQREVGGCRRLKTRIAVTANNKLLNDLTEVPIVPGTDGPVTTKEEATEFCKQHGLPVIFKVRIVTCKLTPM